MGKGWDSLRPIGWDEASPMLLWCIEGAASCCFSGGPACLPPQVVPSRTPPHLSIEMSPKAPPLLPALPPTDQAARQPRVVLVCAGWARVRPNKVPGGPPRRAQRHPLQRRWVRGWEPEAGPAGAPSTTGSWLAIGVGQAGWLGANTAPDES